MAAAHVARAHGTAPCGRGQRLTVLGALGVEGVVDAMTIAAATGGAVVAAFLEQVLLPELRRTKPDAVIVMANLGAHKKAVRELLERSGVACRYLPPYSPDLNRLGRGTGPCPRLPAGPLPSREQAGVGSEIKARLRRATVGAALDAITSGEAGGYFRHAGYGPV